MECMNDTHTGCGAAVGTTNFVNILNTQHYEKLSTEFGQYHLSEVNVLIHLVTTPLGLIGAFSLLRNYTKGSSASLTVATLYILSLVPMIPTGDFIGTSFLCFLIVWLSKMMQLKFLTSVSFIVLGYIIQDLAHKGTGEETFQSTYSAGGHIDFANSSVWLEMFLEHCFYLLPLCVHVALPFLELSENLSSILKAPLPREMQQLHASAWLLGPLVVFTLGSYCLDSKNIFCVCPGMPYFHRVLQCNLLDEEDGKHKSKKEDLKKVRDWAIARDPSENTSSHYWYSELDADAKEAFDACSNATQISGEFRKLFSERHYRIDAVTGMNEVYVTGPNRNKDVPNSDDVFYSRHVDGPFGMFPFVSVYRCIVGMDKNYQITTHFPLASVDQNACEGEVLAFDFHREVHYISSDPEMKKLSDKFRVVLKLHYCVYPRVLAPFGWLMHLMSTYYNKAFRALFLKTIKPANLYEHFLAWNVNTQTYIFDRLETVVGQRNCVYILFAAGLWYATGIYEIFFALTSFVHYFRYIATFYIRDGIDFGSFKRDVLVFKTVALTQILYHYIFPSTTSFVLDFVSIGMVICGYIISIMATNAIGIDRTYFAAELGLVEPKWIEQFPYGYIPHPMIVSQIFALLGFYKAVHFRTEWPYVVPIHIILYLTHMSQEIFDIYQERPSISRSSSLKSL